MSEDNIVYIGSKPAMNYVLAVNTQFSKHTNEVIIKARGRSISKAVDVAEITRKRFVTEAKVKEINIGTEDITTREGGSLKVSSICIVLSK